MNRRQAIFFYSSVMLARAISFMDFKCVFWKLFGKAYHLSISFNFCNNRSKRNYFFPLVSTYDCPLFINFGRYETAIKQDESILRVEIKASQTSRNRQINGMNYSLLIYYLRARETLPEIALSPIS